MTDSSTSPEISEGPPSAPDPKETDETLFPTHQPPHLEAQQSPPNRIFQAIILLLSAHVRLYESIPIKFSYRSRFAHFWAFILSPYISLFTTLLIIITFFEPPSWCVLRYGVHECMPPRETPNLRLPILHYSITLTIEYLCILLLFVEFCLHAVAHGFWEYISILFYKVMLAFLAVYILDLFVGTFAACFGFPWLRLAPYLRIVILGLRSRVIHRQIHLILQILPSFSIVLCILGLGIITYGLFGTFLFPDAVESKDSKRYGNYLRLLWQLYGTRTLSEQIRVNSNVNVWYFLFFLGFLVLFVFFMSNLLIAIVYQWYKDENKEALEQEQQILYNILTQAWEYLDHERKGYLDQNEFVHILQHMYSFKQFRWHLDPSTFNMIYWTLDTNSNGVLSKNEFMNILTVLRLKFEPLERDSFVKVWFPKLFESIVFSTLSSFVKSQKFDYVGVIILTIAAIYGAANFVLLLALNELTSFQIAFSVFISLLFVLETTLQVLVMGWGWYWCEHKFEFFVVLSQIATCTLFFYFVNNQNQLFDKAESREQFTVFLFLIGALQIPANFRLLQRPIIMSGLDLFVSTFIRMVRASYKLIYVLFIFMYFFSVLGVQIFGGQIYDSQNWGQSNMRDMLSALIVFLDILQTNDIIPSALLFSERLNSDLVWIFFILTYVVVVMICLNLVLSYILDIFLQEFERKRNSNRANQMSGKLRFKSSDVYFDGGLVPSQIGNFQGQYRAQLQGYISSHFNSQQQIRSIFQSKLEPSREMDESFEDV